MRGSGRRRGSPRSASSRDAANLALRMGDAQAGDPTAARAAPADRRQKQLSSPCWGQQHPASSPVLPPPPAPLVPTPPAVMEWQRCEQPVGVWRGAGSRCILHGCMKAGSAPPGRGTSWVMVTSSPRNQGSHHGPALSVLPSPSRCAMCHHSHRLALRAPTASSTLENRAGIARICPHQSLPRQRPTPWAWPRHRAEQGSAGCELQEQGPFQSLPGSPGKSHAASRHHLVHAPGCPMLVPAPVLRPVAKHCPVQEPAQLSP